VTDALDRLRAALADRYLIERELGQGGMATVYLAEDLKHHRNVAVKVLKPELGASLGGERFLREIETTAQLSHPHILPIHDSGAADGTLFYVMPYVEGESLRDRLTREAQLPLEDALGIAREVADALAYAHGRGVIHRDIKPENILLQAGHAVVADFGIARALSAAGAERLTETGLAVGTPAYMSPEQAAGTRNLDGRSDIYALGCVLYEMLSGETPYSGATPQSILAKKLSEPLPRISVVRETVPPGLEAAIERALARTPADRWPTAAEFAAALAHPETVRTTAVREGGSTGARRVPAKGWLVGTGVLGVAALAVAALWLLPPRPLNVTVSDNTQVTSEPEVEYQPAISPDGNDVAYVAGPIGLPRLYVRSIANVAGSRALRLGDTALGSEWFPTWSPDGQGVRFFSCTGGAGLQGGCGWSETGKLGGGVRPVPGSSLQVRAWSPDGSRVAFVRNDSIFTTSATDTASRLVAAPALEASEEGVNSLAWSPDGKRLAYVSSNVTWLSSANVVPSAVWVVDAAGGAPRRIAVGDHLNVSPVWLDARHLLFVSDRDGPRGVYVAEVGPKGPRGEPRAVPGIADPHSISYSVAAHRLAYSRLTWRRNIWSYPLAPARPTSIRDGRRVTNVHQVIEFFDVSPDGRWLVFNGYLRRNRSDLYKMPVAEGEPVPLTDTLDLSDPRWSPDGREIAYATSQQEIMVMPADGGPSVRLTSGHYDNSQAWRPDGLWLTFTSADREGGAWRAWRVSRDSVGGAWHEPTRLTDFAVLAADWAPDGSGFVSNYGAEQNGRAATLVVVGRDGKATRRALPGARRLRVEPWMRYSRDGRTIYAVAKHADGRRGIWAIPASGPGEPRLVVAFDDPALNPRPAAGVWNTSIGVGPDRVYLSVAEYESDIWVADLRW